MILFTKRGEIPTSFATCLRDFGFSLLTLRATFLMTLGVLTILTLFLGGSGSPLNIDWFLFPSEFFTLNTDLLEIEGFSIFTFISMSFGVIPASERAFTPMITLGSNTGAILVNFQNLKNGS